MALIGVLILILSGVTGVRALAADIIPAPPAQAPPSQPPAEPPKPDVAPSPRDPGMVKQPETLPHPDSVVNPPVVDPKMAINPETGSPAVETPTRPNPDEPQKKQDR